MSKSNTYVKIVSAGIPNPVDGLTAYGAGARVIELPEGQDVEVRNDLFRGGSIIIFRNSYDDIQRVIYTTDNVYIQESNKTLSSHFSISSTLLGMNLDGSLEVVGYKENPITIPMKFIKPNADDEVANTLSDLVRIFNCTPDEVILSAQSYDRIFIDAPEEFGLTEEFGWLQEQLAEYYNLNLTPISGDNLNRINYFILERP